MASRGKKLSPAKQQEAAEKAAKSLEDNRAKFPPFIPRYASPFARADPKKRPFKERQAFLANYAAYRRFVPTLRQKDQPLREDERLWLHTERWLRETFASEPDPPFAHLLDNWLYLFTEETTDLFVPTQLSADAYQRLFRKMILAQGHELAKKITPHVVAQCLLSQLEDDAVAEMLVRIWPKGDFNPRRVVQQARQSEMEQNLRIHPVAASRLWNILQGAGTYNADTEALSIRGLVAFGCITELMARLTEGGSVPSLAVTFEVWTYCLETNRLRDVWQALKKESEEKGSSHYTLASGFDPERRPPLERAPYLLQADEIIGSIASDDPAANSTPGALALRTYLYAAKGDFNVANLMEDLLESPDRWQVLFQYFYDVLDDAIACGRFDSIPVFLQFAAWDRVVDAIEEFRLQNPYFRCPLINHILAENWIAPINYSNAVRDKVYEWPNRARVPEFFQRFWKLDEGAQDQPPERPSSRFDDESMQLIFRCILDDKLAEWHAGLAQDADLVPSWSDVFCDNAVYALRSRQSTAVSAVMLDMMDMLEDETRSRLILKMLLLPDLTARRLYPTLAMILTKYFACTMDLVYEGGDTTKLTQRVAKKENFIHKMLTLGRLDTVAIAFTLLDYGECMSLVEEFNEILVKLADNQMDPKKVAEEQLPQALRWAVPLWKEHMVNEAFPYRNLFA